MAKKILINAIHTSTGGGLVYLQGILPHLTKILVKEKHEIILLSTLKTKDKLALPSKIKFIEVPKFNFVQIHLWEQLILPFKLHQWGIDAVLCNSNYIPLLAKNAVPIIHNNPAVGKYAKGPWQKIYWPTLVFITRLSMWRAKNVLSVARHIIPVYANGFWRFLTPKIQVATPACNLPVIKAPKPKQAFMLAVGDIYIQKNYITLLKALEIVHKTHKINLIIVGKVVDAKVYAQMQTVIKILGLKKIVTIAKPMPHNKVLELMQQAKILISPSLVECFNMPVLEAMACNTPVVTANLSFQREVAGDFANYYTPVTNEKELANTIKSVLNNPKNSVQKSKNALKYAQQFSWQKSAKIIAKTL